MKEVKELRAGDVTEIRIVAPDFAIKKVLTFRLAIINDLLFKEVKEQFWFVDDTRTYLINGISGGGTTGAAVEPYSIKKFEDHPEYEFVKFWEITG
jgi:hypothetical protein